MSETNKSAGEIARGIVEAHAKELGGVLSHRFTNAIAAAIEKERRLPKPGHVLTSDGVERKVLGTPAITLDGAWVGDGAEVWINYYGGPPAKFTIHMGSHQTPWEGSQSYHHAYSTKEAALARKVSDGKAE